MNIPARAIVIAASWVLTVSAAGQAQTPTQPTIDVGAALDCFAREFDTVRGDECPTDEIRADQILRGSKPAATVVAALDGLVALAISQPDHRVRRRAVVAIAGYGREFPPELNAPALREPVVARLASVLRTADWDLTRGIVGLLGQQVEKDAAAAVIRQVLMNALPEDAGSDMPVWLDAVLGLQQLGALGRTTLTQLDNGSLIADPAAREHVRKLVIRNFQPLPRPPTPVRRP